MTAVNEAVYVGEVVHKRLRPIRHALRYRVFSMLVDCDALDLLERRVRVFSHNRFNLISLFDRDHGEGTPLGPYLRSIAERAGLENEVRRFTMLCYPRVLGYVFNPLTTYFGLDADDRVRLVIYEVSNTFGERMSYVVPAEPDRAGMIAQACRKSLYVSPFNSVSGDYSFHVTPLADTLTVGVALRDRDGPLLKAYFRGSRRDLTDANLIKALIATGWMTVKVIAAIHLEAGKLWLKGLRPVGRPVPPDDPVSIVTARKNG